MFENIIGNEKNKNILEKSIKSGKISHSYIFWGIEGIGKKLIAKQLAKSILCLETKESSCKCKSCIEFDTNNNPDFILIEPEQGKIKIEAIREMQKKVAEKPVISEKKVYIINNAETMTVEAQNCLLKTLEEPPEYVTIILITSNENNLLSTIKSRCTRIYFEPLPKEEIEKYINQNYQEPVSENIIKMAQGSISQVINYQEHQELYANIEKMLKEIHQKDLIETIKMAEEIYNSKEQIQYILEYMESLVLELGKKNIRYVKCVEIIEDTKKRIKANSNYDMCIDNMIFNIWGEINEKNNRSTF